MSRKPAVAVLVDLDRTVNAGGHVKIWERIAETATGFADDVDLTLYFLGGTQSEEVLSDNVRYRTIPAALPTARFSFLDQSAGHTDIAGHNRTLARALAAHDILHATSPFAFARTAAKIARATGKPLVYSVHTDTPKFTRVYTREIVENMFGAGVISRVLLDHMKVGEIAARGLETRTARLIAQSRHAFAASPDDMAWLHSHLPPQRVSMLRRGINLDRFDPARRDRAWLRARYGIPADMPVILFAGRIDNTKGAGLAATIARRLLDRGQAVHLVMAGKGTLTIAIAAQMGQHVTLTGPLPQDELARLMASADLFLFPSETEMIGNVVLEAKAAGCPGAVMARTAPAHLIYAPGCDGLVIEGRDPDGWADALEPVIRDGARLAAMREACLSYRGASIPSWREVVGEDLIPVWKRLAQETAAQ
jgi:glycosyltransferase involved in cell wall biosynthesis